MKPYLLFIILICTVQLSIGQEIGDNEEVSKNRAICDGKNVMFLESFDICNYNSWQLVFEDDFDGNNIDRSKWRTRFPWTDGGDLEYYTDGQNYEFENGILKLVSKDESVYKRKVPYLPDDEILEDGKPNLRWFHFTSGMIFSKYQFDYGKFEIRCKIPSGNGFLPAFWTFTGDPWSEIDVFEFWENSTIDHNMTVHYDYDNDGNTNMCLTDYNGPDFSQDFHTFTIIWEPYKIEWLVDGVSKRIDYQYYYINGGNAGCQLNAWTQYIKNLIFPVNNPSWLIANLGIQYSDASPLPNSMEIDYIRYYQKHPCNNIVITESSDLNLEKDQYNVIFGRNVNISGNTNIGADLFLAAIAKESVVLEPNFHAKSGCHFEAKVNPSLCSGGHIEMKSDSKKGNNPTDLTDVSVYKNSHINNLTPYVSNEVTIFPNPNSGKFKISLNLEYFKDGKFEIVDIYGKIVYSCPIRNFTTEVSLMHLQKNLYFVKIYDRNNELNSTMKLIYQ